MAWKLLVVLIMAISSEATSEIDINGTEDDVSSLNDTSAHEENFWIYEFSQLHDLVKDLNETEKIRFASSPDKIVPKNSVEAGDIENNITIYATIFTEEDNYTASYETADKSENISLNAEYYDSELFLNSSDILPTEFQNDQTTTTFNINTILYKNVTAPVVTEVTFNTARENIENTGNNKKSKVLKPRMEEEKNKTDMNNKSRNDSNRSTSEEKQASTQFGNRQTLYQNSTVPVDSTTDMAKGSEFVSPKPIYNGKTPHVYILRRSCSGSVNIEKVLYPHNSSKLCNELSKNISKPLSCESYYALNHQINKKIEQMLKNINTMKFDDPNSILEVIKLHFDDIPHTFIFVKDLCSESSIISVMTVIIAVTAVIIFFFFSCMLFICIKIKCRRKSTSLDLSDIPHLTLSVDDYKLAPIPRPSISFPDRNRDFIHAFANEGFPPPRSDDTILSQHHFSGSSGKTYDVVSGGKDVPSSQEMHTFSGKRSYRSTKERRSPSSHDYATTDSWERRAEHKDRESKNGGVDNPSFRRW